MHAPERGERLAATLLLVPALALGAEPEPLDEEFLEFLAEFDEDDDWAWFTQDARDEAAAKKTAAKPAPVDEPLPVEKKVQP